MAKRWASDHAHGLAPACIYPERIKSHERMLAQWEALAAADPEEREWRKLVANTKRAITRARNEQQRAEAWEAGREERKRREYEAAVARIAKRAGVTDAARAVTPEEA